MLYAESMSVLTRWQDMKVPSLHPTRLTQSKTMYSLYTNPNLLTSAQLTTIWTMSGYDAPFHLSEECSNANVAGPRAIVATAQSGLWIGKLSPFHQTWYYMSRKSRLYSDRGRLRIQTHPIYLSMSNTTYSMYTDPSLLTFPGWAIIMVIVYTVKDIPDVVAGQYGQPFGSLCLQVLGKNAGLAMFSLNIIAQFFVGQGCTITATRVIFAYSRDGALPGSRYWSRVSGKTYTPVWATWGVLTVAALLGLLMFASPVAIGAVFSIGAIGQYTAFTFPVALKLFFDNGPVKRFRPGPWHLGRFSRPLGAIAVAWWLIIVPALCFPAVKGSDLTLLTMNWTCLIYGGSMTLALSWYAVDARKWFKGPRINVEHTNAVLEGRENESSESASGEKVAHTTELKL
jgi:amino acid transporter